MKIDYGPGYRVYSIKEQKIVYILLCGGDKSSQPKDIKQAINLTKNILKMKR